MAGKTEPPRQANKVLWVVLFCLTGAVACCCRQQDAGVVTTATPWPSQFGFGRAASLRAIDSLNTDVRPDGEGLPSGSGIAATGRILFAEKCARCHGLNGIGGPYGSLVTLPLADTAAGDKKPEKTIGNYWPYATTVFDYVRRAMPFDKPGSLSDEEVYHLTAYLLSANALIDSTTVIDAHSLPQVRMPAQALFIDDDRKGGPEVR
jgi:mono/diheme cytochrome c family protein